MPLLTTLSLAIFALATWRIRLADPVAGVAFDAVEFLLAMRLLDTIFLVAPTFAHGGFPIHWLDVVIPAGLTGIWLYFFARQLRSRALMPLNDPYLKEAFAHDAH